MRPNPTPELVGFVGLMVAIIATFIAGRGRPPARAGAGAIVQAIGEAWHAYSHLAMRPNPPPELVGFVGLMVAIIATFIAGRGTRRSRVDGFGDDGGRGIHSRGPATSP